MIKWNSNFQIDDATVQLSEAYVRVTEFKNMVNKCSVSITIGNLSGEIIAKQYSKTFDRLFNDEDEIYQELLKDFSDAIIV